MSNKRANDKRFSQLMNEEFGDEITYKPKVPSRDLVLNCDEGII